MTLPKSAADYVEREILCEVGGIVIRLHGDGAVMVGSVGRPWGNSMQAQLSPSDVRELLKVLCELEKELR